MLLSWAAQETRAAIVAASEGDEKLARAPGKGRGPNILRDWFNIIMANQEDLARIMTLEQGKVIAESRGEVGLRRLV